MRQEGCDAPSSAWDSEADQGERIAVCDALRTCWEELLLEHGRKSPAVEGWERLRNLGPRSLEEAYTDEEIRAALGPEYREEVDRFFEEGRSYSLRIQFADARATLRAIGFPLEESQIVLTIDKWFPFQFNDLVSQAKPAFLIGPKGSGVAFAASLERMDFESGQIPFYGDEMTLENIRNLHHDFQNGTFIIDAKPRMAQEERKEPHQPAPVTGLGKIMMGLAGRFTRRAA